MGTINSGGGNHSAGRSRSADQEMFYVAVSVSNQCGHCIAAHIVAARRAGMTDAVFAELMAVVGMTNETNRLPSGYQVESDPHFR
jgi:AhpD family alkylhydroperoxidase